MIVLGNWDEFVALVRGNSEHHSLPESRGLLFRGHSDSKWELSTTLERSGRSSMSVISYYQWIAGLKPQVEAFTGRRWPELEVEKISADHDGFLQTLFRSVPAYPFLIYLRHHGFPSPLLDWTASPFVAAYFAFAETRPQAKSRAIYALDCGTMMGSHSVKSTLHRLNATTEAHPRHFRQSSEYTVCCEFDQLWSFAPHDDLLVDDAEPDSWLVKIEIPSSERVTALRYLDQHGLTEFSLFGSEESLLATLALKDSLEHDAP